MWTILGSVITSLYISLPFSYLAIAYYGRWYAPVWFIFAIMTSMPPMVKLSNWEQRKEK